MSYYVYILASRPRGTLYIGVTNNVQRRVYEHRNGMINGFSRQYNIHHLVYLEAFSEIYLALSREKQLKNWKRSWKISLIENENPGWKDLYDVCF